MPRRPNLLASLSLATLVALATLFTSEVARADAVPPAPRDCPKGQTGVTSHRGPQCLLNAPKDCPVGWIGILGGDCTLQPCEADSACQNGLTCQEHSVCLEPYEDAFYDYGEEHEREQASPPRSVPGSLLGWDELLAGPMAPKVRRPKPVTRYNAVNVCARDVACGAPSTCQPQKLCAPKGKRAVGYSGKNVQSARVARYTAAPVTVSSAKPEESVAVAPNASSAPSAPSSASPSDVPSTASSGPTVSTPPAPEKRGCGGCSAASRTTEPWTMLALGLALLIGRRRRQDPVSRPDKM